MKLFNNMTIENNTLHIGSINTVDLAKQYETPLYVMDADYIKNQCTMLKQHFKHPSLQTEILYASKAFSSKAIYQLINKQALALDVVSGGELYTAIEAKFPMERVYFHGNNKSMKEINMAVQHHVHRIIVDNLMELEYIISLQTAVNILLRVNPGIEAHTHEYIQTAMDNSKFGISFDSNDLTTAIGLIQTSEHVTLKGLHCHVGSQIHESSTFEKTATVMLDQIKLLEYKYQLGLTELNLGGGFGVYYAGDIAIEDYSFLSEILTFSNTYIRKHGLKINKMMIEPGRLIVANAGTTLYEVGFSKETLSGRQFVFVDGGMTDNIRPALYQAEYEACIANKMNDEETINYTIAGKCCESGDILIDQVMLPEATRGDIIAVASTGAYNYSMSSHYNRIPKPAVILIDEGVARPIIRREQLDDLVRYDL